MKILSPFTIISILLIITFLLPSCSQKEYITPVDLESLDLKKTGITEKENAEMSKKFFYALIENTVNKYLPPTTVFDLTGEEYDLAELINGKTIIVSSDPYCGFGEITILENFPYAQEKLHKKLEDVNILCLAIREEEDDDFKRFLSDLQKHYQQVYIIDNEQALSINMLGATQYYINNKGVIKLMGFAGGIDSESIVNEIIQGLERIQ